MIELPPLNELKFDAYTAGLRTFDESRLSEPGAALPALVLAHSERLAELLKLVPNRLERIALIATVGMDLDAVKEQSEVP